MKGRAVCFHTCVDSSAAAGTGQPMPGGKGGGDCGQPGCCALDGPSGLVPPVLSESSSRWAYQVA